MKKAFERLSIVPVPGLGVSLPLSQAFSNGFKVNLL